jgi:type VI protein secretion system component Hcp
MVVGIAWAVSTGLAFAAADYFLKIDGIDGESSSAPNVEVQSFSWGASNPSSVGSSGMSAGKVNVQDLSITTASAPRDAASGQATGRRSATSTAAAVSAAPVVAEPKSGEMASFSVAVRESPTLSSTGGSSLARACASGKHFPSVTLTARGISYTLQDVAISSCTVSGEMRTAQLTGHVTLIK